MQRTQSESFPFITTLFKYPHDLHDPQFFASEVKTELEAVVDDLKDILEELETNGNSKG